MDFLEVFDVDAAEGPVRVLVMGGRECFGLHWIVDGMKEIIKWGAGEIK